jgi:hypothetical protein
MRARTRKGEAWWRNVVGEWTRGGGSAAEVARVNGVTAASLYRWKKRLAQEVFVEITPEARPFPPEVIVLTWNGAARVEIPVSLGAEALVAVFAAAVRV